jgi:uncharacterized protein (TIGR02466 family)
MEILNLFPTAVLQDNLGKDFTDAEQASFSKLQSQTRGNAENTTSISSEILERPEFAELKQFCLDKTKFYMKNILAVPDTVEPYITLSWLNFTNKGQQHHRHAHSNSILSGVFYIHAKKDVDKIHFFKDRYVAIDLGSTSYNPFNSETWWVPVGTGDIVIFPSSLCHGVIPTNNDYTRVSLAFNVFIRGEIGSRSDLKWLNIK